MSRQLFSILYRALLLVGMFITPAAFGQSYLEIFGENAENKTYHFFIDESEGETSFIDVAFSPNDGGVTDVEIWSNLNRRDLATLSPADPNTVSAGDTNVYWGAHTMSDVGGGRYELTLPVEKCGGYDITVRYKVSGDPNWRWYGGRNANVVVSDVATRDLVVYEMQAHVVDATGDDFASRSTFPDLYDSDGFSLDNWNMDYLETLGVNCIWLQPFHPIGAKSDCNTGDPGSPYSIKNLFEVAEYLGSDNTRATAMTEFQNFINAADAKGIQIISDVIFNHVSTDVEIARDPDNPAVVASSPLAEMRNVKPQWFSRYLGGSLSGCPTDKNGLNTANFLWGEPAQNAGEIGPAPADRHDFMWPDAYDLFWGTYSALGDISNTDDAYWNADPEVKKMVEYYAYFLEYWINQTDGKMGGFRCDFAQGIPRRAWQYLVNRAKSIKPELYFVAESLDGGNIARRAWKGGFDALNENQLWAIVQNNDISTTDLRSVIDQRKNDYGFALILRGTINHDQGPWISRKWDAMAMHGVFCAIDGTPQLYQAQALGYDQPSGQFSRTRIEFGREIPDIRNWHNFQSLWNPSGDNLPLWYRYADANKGRARSIALRLANQYYIDQVNGNGPHQRIFSVLKYENAGWDPADNEVVLALVNLRPWEAQSGTFNVSVPVISLNPTKTYNVRNLASSTPNTLLWPTPRSGADIAANGIFVAFSGDPSQEGSVTQYLKLEEDGGGTGGTNITALSNTRQFPLEGDLDSGETLYIDIEASPQGASAFGKVVWSLDGVTWNETDLIANPPVSGRDAWYAPLGPFAAGQSIEYAIQVVDQAGDSHWDNNGGVNYTTTVNAGGNGSEVVWIGNTTHYPTNGAIDLGEDLWIDCETWPQGTAAGVGIVYSSDGGLTWDAAAQTPNGQVGNNDAWHINLGSFPAGATVEFAVSATDSLSNQIWDNNGGSNYLATVNGSSGETSVEWIGNTTHIGAGPPLIEGIAPLGVGAGFTLDFNFIKNGATYNVLKSTSLDEWDPVAAFTGSGAVKNWTDTDTPSNSVFYAVEGATWPAGATVLYTDDLLLQIETYPTGAAVTVQAVYTTDGVNWPVVPLSKVGTNGENDLWQVNLGRFPAGISVQYAIEVIDDQGVSTWDNNDTGNFHVPIVDPNAPDTTPPVLTYTPEDLTTTSASLDVALFATDAKDPSPSIYYTTDGSPPTSSSVEYSGTPITVNDAGAGVDLTIKAIAIDNAANASPIISLDVKVNETFTGGGTKPYSINLTLGSAVPNGAITIDGSASEWSDSMIIALDMANDDPRSLGSNWTMHEAPIDLTHLWAAWDDSNLYIAWQYVDVTDILDPANAGGAGSGKISNNDGILQWIAIDTIDGAGAELDVWSKNEGEPYWTGSTLPDYQIYLAGSLWQGYISRAVNGVFALDDGGMNYMTVGNAGIMVDKGDLFADDELWGVGDCDARFDGGSPDRNFLAEGHDTSRDGFFEMSIPLSFLGLTRSQLESNGVGILIGTGSVSAMDSIPHDEATVDSPGVEAWNSSFEWGDIDSFTTPFARVGAP